MSEPLVRQMKLTSGDEIICEVIDWVDDEGPMVVVRNPLRVITVDKADGMRYHIFRPYMVMQLEEGVFQTLNSDHIIIEGTPVKEVVKEYYNAISVETEQPEEDTDKKFNEYMEKIKDMLDAKEASYLDSDAPSNTVIRFPGKNKLH